MSYRACVIDAEFSAISSGPITLFTSIFEKCRLSNSNLNVYIVTCKNLSQIKVLAVISHLLKFLTHYAFDSYFSFGMVDVHSRSRGYRFQSQP